MLKDLERDFREPGAWHRGKPFWAWNGKLEPDELRRQIRLMQRMGLGGFFMHSRVGLDTAVPVRTSGSTASRPASTRPRSWAWRPGSTTRTAGPPAPPAAW